MKREDIKKYFPDATEEQLKGLLDINSADIGKGDYDNAPMESFYRTIKRELINDASFESVDEAKAEIFKYIEMYYNTKRMHSTLEYLTPVEYEKMLTD